MVMICAARSLFQAVSLAIITALLTGCAASRGGTGSKPQGELLQIMIDDASGSYGGDYRVNRRLVDLGTTIDQWTAILPWGGVPPETSSLPTWLAAQRLGGVSSFSDIPEVKALMTKYGDQLRITKVELYHAGYTFTDYGVYDLIEILCVYWSLDSTLMGP